MNSTRPNQHLTTRLPRSLSALETWGFGLTGHVGWIGTAPIIHAAVGSQAIFIWLPGVIVSVLLNLQVQSLGRRWPDVAGGTPNYADRLLKNFPGLGSYVAIGYYIGWVAAPVIYAIVITDLIKANLTPLGIACPETILKVGFTVIAFIVGLSGSRALGILHLFFVVPAAAFLIAFCLQGLGWLAFSIDSPGLLPTHWFSLSIGEWAKWFFISTISVYSCETASSFVADSRQPRKTLHFLSWSAWLIPPVFLGGSWVLTQLATQPGSGDNLYLNLLAASPFWGKPASFFVTLLIAFCCLLSCATAVANTSRILYQLALDRRLSPVFAVVSQRGVLEPALIFTCILSLLCLIWGDISHVVMITGTSYLTSIMGFHLGLWLQRDKPEVLWPWWSFGFFVIEAVVLVVGGLAWSWKDLLIGLLLPIVILIAGKLLSQIQFAPFHPQWWLRRYHAKSSIKNQDFVVLQVIVLISLICSAATVSWIISGKLNRTSAEPNAALLAIILVTLSFVGVAIACWTTLPQISAIDEAHKQAKNLLITTLDTVLDTILIIDEKGKIRHTNPAAETLFQINIQDLTGHHLNEYFSVLPNLPEQWPSRSELTVGQSQTLRIVEATLSRPSSQKSKEYVVILRDITERKQAELALQTSYTTNRALLNAIPDLMFRVNKSGILVNFKVPEGSEMLTFFNKFLGKSLSEILPPELAHLSMHCLEQALQTGKLQIFESQLELNKQLHDYEARLVVSAEDEVMAIVRDITERKRAESDIQNALEKEKELSELKSRFVSMASHEFRTPLTTIFSSSELLQDYGHKWAEEKKLLHYQRIQTAVKHMIQLLNDVLLIGQAEAGHFKFCPAQMDIVQFCHDLVEEMQITTKNHTIASNVQIKSSTVELDEKLLRHILSNLLSNAIKYSPSGGTINFVLIEELEKLIFQVQDSGIGIPVADQAKLFDSFHRATNVGTISGTGLGLAIVKKAVDLHGGNITVESEVRSGTTFTVSLPIIRNI
jgi:PAS domain S-box-containing protein